MPQGNRYRNSAITATDFANVRFDGGLRVSGRARKGFEAA